VSESCSSAVARLRNDLYCVEWGVQLYSNQPTNPQLLQRERQTDGRTDGRTDARQLHRPCSAYYTGSVNNPPSPIHCWLVHVGGSARVCDLTAWNCQELNSTNKSVFSLLRRLSTRRYPHWLLNAGSSSTETTAINRYLLPAGRSATNPPAAGLLLLLLFAGQTNGRTDGQTPGRHVDPAPVIIRAASIINLHLQNYNHDALCSDSLEGHEMPQCCRSQYTVFSI